jgi:hypothetical protein
MQTGFMRFVRIAAVCGAALLLVAQTTPAASSSSSVRPITGTFSGFSDESSVVTSWHGSLRFATPIGGSECCGLTSGDVSWNVKGTDSNTGCTWDGSGQFSIVQGKMAGEPTGASATLNPPFYNIDFQTPSTNGIPGYDQFGPVVESCPGSTPLTTFVHISAWIYGGDGGPYKIKPGGLLIDTYSRKTVLGKDSWSWNFQGQTCPEPNVKTGKGYNKLSASMKSRLTTLYGILDKQNACYRFNIGFRDETVQRDLYDRWHQIADGHKGQKKLCQALKAAGFAQCPTGWTANGKAKGGPAKPGKSRHEKAEAADIKVKWPPKYDQNTAKFRAVARQAGLCGPPNSDPVHVEMPYKVKGQKKASCHFT